MLKNATMKKLMFATVAMVLLGFAATAQSVEDGVKLLYYRKGQSAKAVLQKVYDGKPKDPVTIYWLGQALLLNDDVAGAKSLYQKALQEGINDPWIWVGIAHVELLEKGDINAAKQKFEQAITATTATKGRNKGMEDVNILLAVARANADGDSKIGDPQYGADKAIRAAQVDPTNAEAPYLAGVNYLKMGSEYGGKAVEQFTEATTRDARRADAFYRIGRVYQSQDNKESMDRYYSKAIEADAAYAPTYLAYFNYYENKDVNVAKEYLDKYVANSDQDCATEYYVANYLFRAGKYQESLQKAQQMEAGACKSYNRVQILYAYNYQRLGDSIKAKDALDKFFTSEAPEKVQAADYGFAADLYIKFPAEQEKAIVYVEKAAELETNPKNKIILYNEAAADLAKVGKFDQQILFLQKAIALKGSAPTESDFYKMAKAASDAVTNNVNYFATADSICAAYIAAFPDKPQGYSFRVLSAKKADIDSTKGLFVAPILEQNNFFAKDLEKYRKSMFVNYYTLLVYYNDKAKDVAKAVEMTDKMLELYPTPGTEENSFATSTKKALQALLNKGSKPATSGGAKPAGAKG